MIKLLYLTPSQHSSAGAVDCGGRLADRTLANNSLHVEMQTLGIHCLNMSTVAYLCINVLIFSNQKSSSLSSIKGLISKIDLSVFYLLIVL